MKSQIYLPPKGSSWDNPSSITPDDDITQYSGQFDDMNVLNSDTIEDAIYPSVDDVGLYNHKDGKYRHPETLYLVPGNPRHRSDSQAR